MTLRRLLLGIATLLFLLSTAVSGQFRRSGLTKMGETLDVGLAVTDTVFLIADNFLDGNLDNWTEVGNVSVVSFEGSNVLKITVEGGGSDNIYQTIPSCNEYEYRFRVHISDADTSDGWTNGELCYLTEIKQSGTNNGRSMFGVIHTGGTLKWMVSYTDDAGGSTTSNGTTEVDTDTWYTLLWHIKKATATGADDGISNLKVDGVEEIAITDWDNPAVTYNHISAGYWSSPFNAIYYIDPVVFWSNEGLP